MPSGVTVVRGGTVIGYTDGRHSSIAGADVAFQDGRVIFLGERYEETADVEVDARGKYVVPGMVATHVHVSCNAGDRLILDHGRPEFQRTGFLNHAVPREGAPTSSETIDDIRRSMRYGLTCLLKSGVTTAVGFGSGGLDAANALAEEAAACGLRLYSAPTIQGGTYRTDRRGMLRRTINEEGALKSLVEVTAFLKDIQGARAGRVRGIIVMDEFFNSTPKVLKEVRLAADRLGVGVTLHFAEQVLEYHDCVANHGCTPVRLLHSLGFLGPDVILAHGIYVTGHRFCDEPGDDDLVILEGSGATVAHCPVAIARRGACLESFKRYRDAGVRLSIGCDSYPMDLWMEVKFALMMGRLASGTPRAVSEREVFEAATLGGAEALGRAELGRLCVGSAADLSIMKLPERPSSTDVDGIERLVLAGTASCIEAVYVDGEPVVQNGRLMAWDEEEILEGALSYASARWEEFRVRHWTRKPPGEVFPGAFPTADGMSAEQSLG